jgi:DNA processing protein
MHAVAAGTISETAAQYLRFHLADNVGPIILSRLLERFGSIDRVLSASTGELSDVEGVGTARAGAIRQARDGQEVDAEIARAREQGVSIICREDEAYPAHLRHIADPPICLYLRGDFEPTDAVALAVVGARRCSHYGMEQASRFAYGLAGLGFTIVSGLARGIDSCSHRAALSAGGRTLAVLGNGLASIYPPEHAELAEDVADQGAIVSELPMTAGPEAAHFPRRNRIIAGLSLGVLVVEAGPRSGALITARLASEYDREVFAVPGRVDVTNSAGTNSMIRGGQAKLIANIEDVLDELGDVGRFMAGAGGDRQEAVDPPQGPRVAPTLTDDERRVLAAIGDDEVGLEALGQRSGIGTGKLTATLTGLQVKGLVRRLPGNHYVRLGAGR